MTKFFFGKTHIPPFFESKNTNLTLFFHENKSRVVKTCKNCLFDGFFVLAADQKVKVLSPFKWRKITILDAILVIYKKISI